MLRLRWMFGLIVLMLALALAACGGDGDEEGEENGGWQETPAATKTVEPEETEEPEETAEPEKTPKPSGGGASLGDVPVYPGADKVGEYSGDYSIPMLGEDLDVEDYQDVKWAAYESDDSVDDIADFYKDKMPDKGWEQEGWFDITFGEGASWGSFTRDDGDSAAWIFVAGSEDQTVITIGVGSR